MVAMRDKKKLEELPQRAVILEARSKKKAIEQKRAQLDALHAKADAQLSRIDDEDRSLSEKQRQVQSEIDAVRGDYRGVEARTKELNGFAKRRNTLEADLTAVGDELAKIEGVQAQVASALESLERQEAEATAAFVKEGGALKDALARIEAERAMLASSLPADLLDAYKKTAARTGGVAVGRLQGSNCGVCRMAIEGGRLIDMKGQGNVAPLPHCERLLYLKEVIRRGPCSRPSRERQKARASGLFNVGLLAGLIGRRTCYARSTLPAFMHFVQTLALRT